MTDKDIISNTTVLEPRRPSSSIESRAIKHVPGFQAPSYPKPDNKEAILELSKPAFLDQDMLNRTRKVGGAVNKVGKEAVESTSDVINHITGEVKQGVSILFSNAPVSEKVKRLRVPLLSAATAVFGVLTLKNATNFTTGLFSKSPDRHPIGWTGFQLLFSGALTAGIYRTLTGTGKVFGKMSSVGIGALGYFLINAMNNLYDEKGILGKVIKKIFGADTISSFKNSMNFFNPLNPFALFKSTTEQGGEIVGAQGLGKYLPGGENNKAQNALAGQNNAVEQASKNINGQ